MEYKICEVGQLCACYGDVAEKLGLARYAEDKQYAVRLVICELASNVLLYGKGECLVSAELIENTLILKVSGGAGFEPQAQPIDTNSEHGRGMLLVDGFCASYHYEDGGRTAVCVIDLACGLKTNYQTILQTLHGATLVAATKTVSVERLRLAERLGIRIFGENRVQELLEKYEYFPEIEWHFIGHLQTNKVRQIVGKVSLIHSVSSVKLAEEIQRQAEKLSLVQDILLEVNPAREESKSGFYLEEVDAAAREIARFPNIRMLGLMAMVPREKNIENNVKYYLQMRQKYDIMKTQYDFQYLSMGMSADYAAAIACGANMVRIGSGLFGERYERR